MSVRPRLFSLFWLLILLLPASAAAAAPACGAPATAISDVQGSGTSSALAGQAVTVEGILTLDSRSRGGFGGFYLQQADHQTDGNPATSEALFVYTNRETGTPGSVLRVTGEVREFHGLTELVAVRSIRRCGKAQQPAPVVIELPWSKDPESLENMKVTFRRPLTVVDNYNLAKYGELALAASDQVQPTEYLAPGRPAHRLSGSHQRNRVLLDDNRSRRDPRPVPWPPEGLSVSTTVRAGDQVDRLTGILDFRFDAWRIQPTRDPRFLATNPRKPAPSRPAGMLIRVMALNLGNYFNGNGQGAGFPTPRGAETRAGFSQQQRRLVQTLTAPDPDILAVSELENDGYGPNSAIAGLTRALGNRWDFVRTPGADGDDEIRTALLYRNDRITPVGSAARLTEGVFRSAGRPPLAQAFRRIDGNQTVKIVVPHLKSKSCRGAGGSDRDQSDGQGCYASRRVAEARALANWPDAAAEGARSAGSLIVGDLNSYAREQPLAILYRAGFTSLVHRFHPCSRTSCPSYTYRYRGEKDSLDYALASEQLIPHVLRAEAWLVNADEPRAIGYQGLDLAGQQGPWRSSDHNPVIVDLRL